LFNSTPAPLPQLYHLLFRTFIFYTLSFSIYTFSFSTSYAQLWVGIILTAQPFFISGIEDYDQAKSSAFGAMAMFIVTFVASLLGLWYDSQKKSEETVTESGAPEADYHLSTGDVPTYGTSS